MSSRLSLRIVTTLLILIVFCVSSADARKKDPEFATSANDPILRGRIAGLAPGVDPQEADRVARIAYTIGRELKREWRVGWPPGFHNFLVNTGARKGGLCFQWAERLLLRLAEEKWDTLEFHWAESFETTASEHNVVVVTAKGQHFSHGILLDNWRYGGRLIWGRAIDDPHYQWKQNKAQYQHVLNKRAAATPSSAPAKNPAPASKSDVQTR
jgi:hypothetical protein